jgi:hypothetical protein
MSRRARLGSDRSGIKISRQANRRAPAVPPEASIVRMMQWMHR